MQVRQRKVQGRHADVVDDNFLAEAEVGWRKIDESASNRDIHVATSGSDAADAVVGAAIRGGSLLMLLALIQRASTFVLNLLLQRAMLSTPDGVDRSTGGKNTRPTSALEEYGAAAITLELISSTILFLAREPFRVALARSGVMRNKDDNSAGAAHGAKQRDMREVYRRRFVNTAWLSAPVGISFAAVVRLAYPRIIQNEAFNGVAENRQAATLVCIAAAVELMCEPLALIFQYRLLIDVRVRAEAIAVLVLGVSRYLLVVRAGMGVLSFGYAQLLHSGTLAAAYLLFAARDITGCTAAEPAITENMKRETESHWGFAHVGGWLPSRPSLSFTDERRRNADQWVDKEQLELAGALAGQSVLKHVLTEGDKIVLARATICDGNDSPGCTHGGSLYEQGVYAIASGYGSLAARLLFQPLEEAARLMFSKLGAEERRTQELEADTADDQATTANMKHRSSRRGDLYRLRETMAVVLATLLKLVLTAGLLFVCFGFHYTKTLMRLLMGARGVDDSASQAVSEVARVLSWYCVYVLFLAANGMCEAFACAVARGTQLTAMSVGLVASFATFWALVGPLTARFGTRGLVMANAAGMACRVVCSAVFIRRFFVRSGPSEVDSCTLKSSGVAGASQSPHKALPHDGANLWRQVVTRALPHPCVLAVMAISSAAANAAAPDDVVDVQNGKGVASWDMVASAKHVVLGLICLVFTGIVFSRYERRFLRELRELWAARRPSQVVAKGSAESMGGIDTNNNPDGRRKTD